MFLRPVLLSAALACAAVAAHATPLTGTFAVTVHEGLSNGSGFDTAGGNPYSGSNTATASFNYTGELNFDNETAQNGPVRSGDQNSAFGFSDSNISNYDGEGRVLYNSTVVANFNNLDQFLRSSGSASDFTYGSYYTFDLGTLVAGTVLSITHDDGISLFQGNTRIGTSVSGPTSKTTDTITITNTGDTMLRYARENGTPSVLQVSAVTPEPSSLALLGTGVLSLAGMVRRRLA